MRGEAALKEGGRAGGEKSCDRMRASPAKQKANTYHRFRTAGEDKAERGSKGQTFPAPHHSS